MARTISRWRLLLCPGLWGLGTRFGLLRPSARDQKVVGYSTWVSPGAAFMVAYFNRCGSWVLHSSHQGLGQQGAIASRLKKIRAAFHVLNGSSPGRIGAVAIQGPRSVWTKSMQPIPLRIVLQLIQHNTLYRCATALHKHHDVLKCHYHQLAYNWSLGPFSSAFRACI